ncbi:putative transposase [Desmospora profundinema]|uniref:Transposase n=1 Tax=Desmospora profundinema TaxID=1571184 RepID=A0ABU1IT84_9BACL|nr:putative transposase [Desmospora profundinema]
MREAIRTLCGRFPTYGYRRIRVWLKKEYGYQVNHKRILRLMKEMGLTVCSLRYQAKRKKRRGSISVQRSNEHLQVDMTKIWCGKDGWGYLFAVIDEYDKEIVDYSFSRFCRTTELLQAVNQALHTRFPDGVYGQGLTIRSDNGCQMTSRRFVQAMKAAGIRHERMGYNNHDGDAYIERWFRTLKEESVWLQEYDSFAQAQQDLDDFIAFYNHERPHSALRYRSPVGFRQSLTSTAA